MKVINQTKKRIIAEDIVVPKTLLEQAIGLLKYKTPVAILLKTRFGIHTLDMGYSIDILVLDNQNNVVAIKENLQPNRIFFWNIKYKTILELPADTIKKTETETGDTINFK
jgi:uncharacterized membrane protein (UPF0127 family)